MTITDRPVVLVMATAGRQRGAVTSWSVVDKNLRKLHRRGLYDLHLDGLDALVETARKLSDRPTDAERIEHALALAIEHGLSETRRDVARLWFGLRVEGAPDTRSMTSTQRHNVAWERWDKGAESTFCTHWAEATYKSVAKALLELGAATAEVVTTTQASQTLSRNDPLSTKYSPAGKYLGPHGRANGAIASEVRAILVDGMKHTVEHGQLPILTETANAAYYPHASLRNRMEALLTWAIASCEFANWDTCALFELVGVGTRRQRSRAARRRRAYVLQYPTRAYRLDDSGLLFQEVKISLDMSEPLWELATGLDVPCGPCLAEMHTNREYIAAPDTEIDGLLRLLLYSGLGLVDIENRTGVVRLLDSAGVLTLR